jgi:hypothetical protein
MIAALLLVILSHSLDMESQDIQVDRAHLVQHQVDQVDLVGLVVMLMDSLTE